MKSLSPARERDNPAIYDAFVVAFPVAAQTSESMTLAVAAERRDIFAMLAGLPPSYEGDEKRERVARRLFNDARVAEDAGQDWIAVRKYGLLQDEKFRDTRVFTEMKDRIERLRFQQVMETHQKALAIRINTLQTAVVSELHLAGDRLEGKLDKLQTAVVGELHAVGYRLNSTISEYNRRIEAGMAAQAGAFKGYVDSQVGALGGVIREQAQTMDVMARQTSAESDALFRRSQEAALERDVKNRRCAELLTREGKYGWFSGCD